MRLKELICVHVSNERDIMNLQSNVKILNFGSQFYVITWLTLGLFQVYSTGDPFDHGSSVEERNTVDTETEETMTEVCEVEDNRV